MAAGTIRELILKNLDFEPNSEQLALVAALAAFVTDHGDLDVFVLNGYAGTGKTSIIGALVKALGALKKKTVVLAPTGRAAKVASKFSSGKASTIHKRLFRGNSLDPVNQKFFLAENKDFDTIFIVDEASLITDGNSLSTSLLLQLIRHVYHGKGCSLILLGDLAQLPPVGQDRSLAMDAARLRSAGLNPICFSLVQPARQEIDSGILFNATIVRQFLLSNFPIENFSIYKRGFNDVEIVDSSELFDSLYSSWKHVGKDETIVITRSNFRANNINNAIRKYLLDADAPLIPGERLIIAKNDYYWSKENKLDNFLANGESIIVNHQGKLTKKYGRWFADSEIQIPGNTEPLSVKIMLRSLATDGPAIPKDEMERFYNRILSTEEGELSQKIKAAFTNPFYNALQVKYGYCVTCHKAQGGQWKNVFIDMGGLSHDLSESEFFRWLYTAVTRATERVYFINSPFPIE